MSRSPATPPNPPIHFPKWAALLGDPATAADAVDQFKKMATKDSGPFSERPSREAINPKQPKAMPLRVYITIAEPDGKQDHCLFKNQEDKSGGRKNKGWQLPQDYLPERGERIEFLPEVLRRPDWVFEEKSKPNNWIFACQTGPDEFYMVVVDIVHRKSSKHVECELLSAYPVDTKGWRSKLKRWRKIFSR